MAPTPRLAAGVLAGALALVPVAGCSFTSNGFSCSGSTCTITLDGEGSEVEVLGTTVTLGSVQDGRASISVAGASVSCGEGESVNAGSLSLECTSVSGDTVELTASLG
ncbi:hypothetical protein ACI79J_04150 [Geodermatophilus sp. SYSU D01062]